MGESRVRARAFRAIDAVDLGAQADSANSTAAAEDALTGTEAQVNAQFDSPAKGQSQEEARRCALSVARPTRTRIEVSLNGLIGAISSDAALAESLRPTLDEVTAQVNDTASETERAKNLTAEMSKADLGCHQLAFVTEVFKGL